MGLSGVWLRGCCTLRVNWQRINTDLHTKSPAKRYQPSPQLDAFDAGGCYLLLFWTLYLEFAVAVLRAPLDILKRRRFENPGSYLTVIFYAYLVDNNLREVVLLVPATMVTPGGVAIADLLPGRRGLATHEHVALGAEAVVPRGGLVHAATYRERLGQKEHRDGDER